MIQTNEHPNLSDSFVSGDASSKAEGVVSEDLNDSSCADQVSADYSGDNGATECIEDGQSQVFKSVIDENKMLSVKVTTTTFHTTAAEADEKDSDIETVEITAGAKEDSCSSAVEITLAEELRNCDTSIAEELGNI